MGKDIRPLLIDVDMLKDVGEIGLPNEEKKVIKEIFSDINR